MATYTAHQCYRTSVLAVFDRLRLTHMLANASHKRFTTAEFTKLRFGRCKQRCNFQCLFVYSFTTVYSFATKGKHPVLLRFGTYICLYYIILYNKVLLLYYIYYIYYYIILYILLYYNILYI